MSAYAFLIGIGASLGLWRMLQRVPRWQASRWLNAGLYVLTCGLLGARTSYVLLHIGYYNQHLLEALQFWQGGLTWPGMVVGGLAALVGVALAWRVPLGQVADPLAAIIPPLAIAAFLACWFGGCAYGPAAPAQAWWGVPCRDEANLIAARLPLQPLIALILIVYYWRLETLRFPREGHGQFASLVGFGLALNLLLVSVLRADPSPTWSGLRPDLWLALGLCAASLLSCLLAFWPRTRKVSHS